jgi:RNA polymerase sigma-70 factor (ECF subfamily)
MGADLSVVVRAAQGGDDEAFRRLYRSVQPGLLRYLAVLVGPDAEDVASETWLQIARNLRSFDTGGGDGFRAWAVMIARNRALDHLRRMRRRPAVSVPVHLLAEVPDGGDTADRASEALGTVRALEMIATLPREQAEAVLLRAVVGLDSETAGRVLGKRPGAVRTAAHRGLRRLAAQLEQSPVGSGPRPAAPDAPRAQSWRAAR